MLKNILNLGGAQELSKNEQKEITGGIKHWCPSGVIVCDVDRDCPALEDTTVICFAGCCQLA